MEKEILLGIIIMMIPLCFLNRVRLLHKEEDENLFEVLTNNWSILEKVGFYLTFLVLTIRDVSALGVLLIIVSTVLKK